MLNIQNYIKVESLEEAYELNQKKNNKIIGGCQDLDLIELKKMMMNLELDVW